MAKTYLITAASGIGAETAKLLVQTPQDGEATQLFIAGRHEEKCAALARELRWLGAVTEYLVGDLTDVTAAPALEQFSHRYSG